MIRQLVHMYFFYISILIFSIVGLLLADWRYKLAFWSNKIASIKAIGFTMLLLYIFDIAGVVNKIFSTNPKYVVGIYLVSPNLPIEEILFLFLLCYSTLIIYKTVERLPWLRTKTP